MESISMYSNITLPLLIFIAKITDVSMGTIRIVLISKNKRKTASILSFFEMFIWIMAISKIMNNLDNLACCIAYAVGYSIGVYIGMLIEERVSKGEFTPSFNKASVLSRLIPACFLNRRSQAH
ncbi:MAG: hypothetical protein JEZ12_03330 [Desulfobacterium sp.]|nr:hypothetical protein [Desulfobacterium sp.]